MARRKVQFQQCTIPAPADEGHPPPRSSEPQDTASEANVDDGSICTPSNDCLEGTPRASSKTATAGSVLDSPSPRKRKRPVLWSKTSVLDQDSSASGIGPLLPIFDSDEDGEESSAAMTARDAPAAEDAGYAAKDELNVATTPSRRKARPRGKGTGHGKKPHKHNLEYIGLRDKILGTLFALDWDAGVEKPCHCGEKSGSSEPALWRCLDCADWTVCCKTCVVERHISSPFHAIQKWQSEKGFFTREEPSLLDLCLYLGHGGRRCPTATKASRREMTIGDINGLHTILVYPCQCGKSGESNLVLQLFHSRLIPATMANPYTAYTFRLMEHWHLDILQSKKPVYDYFMALTRRTRQDTVQDLAGYENFLRAGRWWRDLMSRKESGQGQAIDTYLPETRYPGSTAIVCVACPEPGFNLEDDWKKQMESDERKCRYIKFVNVDGDFKAHQKRKPMDKLDFPLNEGGGYFTPLTKFLKFEKEVINKAPPEPHGPCEAIEKMHMGVDHRKTVWSGIVGCVCGRHGAFYPQSIVNLRLGEKFPNIDLSLVGALGPCPDVDLPVAFQSDRGCHLSINIERRWKEEFPDLTAHHKVLSRAVWSIGKLHIRGHKTECQLKYHPSYMEGHGRTSGEACEPSWVETNHASAISRDCNPGHREEIHNDTDNDWNKKKMINMSSFLMKKAKEAATFGARAKAEFDAYAASISEDVKARWWSDFPGEAAFLDNDKKLQNRCHADRSKLPSQSKLLELIEKEETRGGGSFTRGRGPTAFIKRMIELEKKQENVKLDVADANAEPGVPGQTDEFAAARSYIRQEMSRLRKLQMQHMPGLETVLIAEERAAADGQPDDSERPEEEDLRMPSSFTPEQRREFGWEKIADIEMRVRTCYAEQALEKLRRSVRLFNLGVDGKKRQMNTQMFRTRTQKRLKGYSDLRWTAVDRYTKHYRAMLALGYDTEKDKRFQSIDRKSVKDAKDVTTPAELGDGKREDAWWWRDGQDIGKISKKDKEEMLKMDDEEKRVRYFRYWANWKRFDEEWIILGAEFDRTVRSFGRYEEIWTALAKDEDTTISNSPTTAFSGETHYHNRTVAISSGRRAYAKNRAEFFRVLKERAIESRSMAANFNKESPGKLWDGWKRYEEEMAMASKQGSKRARGSDGGTNTGK